MYILHANTLLPIYYREKKLRGLGILNTKWEASLQHMAICKNVQKFRDQQLHKVHNFSIECRKCVTRFECARVTNV